MTRFVLKLSAALALLAAVCAAQSSISNGASLSNGARIMPVVTAPCQFTPGQTLPNGQSGVPYSASIFTQNCASPVTFQVIGGALPGWATLGSSGTTATVSGSNPTAGSVSFTLQATDHNGQQAIFNASFTINISSGNSPALPDPNLLSWCTTVACTPSPNTLITVGNGTSGICAPSGCNFTVAQIANAIAAATCGQTIELQNTVYTLPNGTITFSTNCDTGHWITMERDMTDPTFPAEGTRVDPCYAGIQQSTMPYYPYPLADTTPNTCARHVPLLLKPTAGSTIQFGPAHSWRFIGIQWGRDATYDLDFNTITMNNNGACTAADVNCQNQQPGHIIFDRNIFAGDAQRQDTRGVSLGGCQWCAILDSYFYDYKLSFDGGAGDAQCWAWGLGKDLTNVGWGKFVNNFCSASTMGQLFCGSIAEPLSPSTNADGIPHDVDESLDHFWKNLMWDTQIGQTQKAPVTIQGQTYVPAPDQVFVVTPPAIQLAVNGTFQIQTWTVHDSNGGTNRSPAGTDTLSCPQGGAACGTVSTKFQTVGSGLLHSSESQFITTYSAPASVPTGGQATYKRCWNAADSRLNTLGASRQLCGSTVFTIVAANPVHQVAVAPNVANTADLEIQPSYADIYGNVRQFGMQFNAVPNFASSSTTWSVDGVVGGNSCTGTIDTFGLYFSPSQTCTPATPTGNFYVSTSGSDSNDGTTPTTGGGHGPWRTIGHAAANATSNQTVVIENGTYVEQVTFNNSGTPGNPITFIAQNKGQAIVAPTGSGQIFTINGSYVTIENLTLQGNASGTNNDGMKFQSPGTGGQAIGNTVHQIGTGNCTGGAPIISAQGSAVISGNLIYDYGQASCNQYEGIYLNDGNNQTVTNNIIAEGTGGSTSATIGIQLNGQEAVAANFPSNEDVANNTIVNVTSWCTLIVSWTGTASNDNFNNNVCYNTGLNGTSGSIRTANNGGGFSNLSIANNLINSSGSTSLASGTSLTGTITLTPQFINYTGDGTGDYHPCADNDIPSGSSCTQASPLIGTGVALGAPANDFDGLPRTPPAPWIGAEQNSEIPQHTITATASDGTVGATTIGVTTSAPIMEVDGKVFTSKNGWELKCGIRVLLEQSLIENAWGCNGNGGGQPGTSLLMQVINQTSQTTNGSGQTVGYGPEYINDVTIRNIITRHTGKGFAIAGHALYPSGLGMHRVAVSQSEFDDVSDLNYGHGFITGVETLRLAGDPNPCGPAGSNSSCKASAPFDSVWTSATNTEEDDVTFDHITVTGHSAVALGITHNTANYLPQRFKLTNSIIAAPGSTTFLQETGDSGDCDAANGSGSGNTELLGMVPCFNGYTMANVNFTDSTAASSVFNGSSTAITQVAGSSVGWQSYSNFGLSGSCGSCILSLTSPFHAGNADQASDNTDNGAPASSLVTTESNVRTGVRTP